MSNQESDFTILHKIPKTSNQYVFNHPYNQSTSLIDLSIYNFVAYNHFSTKQKPNQTINATDHCISLPKIKNKIIQNKQQLVKN